MPLRPIALLSLSLLFLAFAPGLPAAEGERVIVPPVIESADHTTYANDPYWYKPGHPLNPAESASIELPPGFIAERILTVPRDDGSFTALTVDPQGRLLAATQHRAGIYRITPPSPDDPDAETRVEKLGGAAEKMGWSHGLLHAFDSLYVTVSEGNDTTPTGIHRLRDTDGDDQYDSAELLFELQGSGEHGPHNMVVGPDGESLYLMCGNGTPLPDGIARRRPVATTGLDHVMPPGFESSEHTVAGWVLRFDPDGGNRELIGSGLRNSYDLAFNRAGDLFTFDSDMEWDLGAPWYRPTRICHVVSGAEFGWRADAAKWPEHFEDGVGPVVNIGPGSPTGVAFGYGTKFPAEYQRALFVCDWTFATIHAVHLQPDGASYRAEVEEFVGGAGLPVTDLAVGSDGALYFAVGGRRLGSAVYRVRYVGEENTEPVEDETDFTAEQRELLDLRRELESLHGRIDPDAVEKVRPHLGHADRAIRFAARVAIEAQPIDEWRELALNETDLDAALNALLVLARQGSATDQTATIDRLLELPWDDLPARQRLAQLRVLELALARGGDALDSRRRTVREHLRPRLPDIDATVNRELSRVLAYLGDTTVIAPLLELMAADTGERPPLGSGYFVRNPKYGAAVRDMLESAPLLERMHHAQMLLWIDAGWSEDQRRRYFELIADAMTNSRGGHQYREFWERIRETALEQIPTGERERFESIRSATGAFADAGLPVPEGPGREWTLEEALELAGRGLNDRDLRRGREMYSAAGCILCHRVGGEGGALGPDLSGIGRRFNVRDILEATIHPSRAIPDQYQVMTLELTDGKTLSGRIISRDANTTRIVTDLLRPTRSTAVPTGSIRRVRPEPVSTMPSGLLNALNDDELLDLLAFLVSREGGR